MQLSRGPRTPLRRRAAAAALLLCWAGGLSAASGPALAGTALADTGPTGHPAATATAAARPTPAPARAARPRPPASENAADPGDGTPGVVPIILGLVLTGIAVYKHRGLPRGH
ncbi:hypothetical protein ABUW04_35185 [Streptacidiphilus sp. N1-10]|uniref:MYXO-CTERM domain-containing protein n=1 Tax=Streptacidiphilus jeojiensis TaxID=3229225 RepID=A0ABV6XZ23_9ACTN